MIVALGLITAMCDWQMISAEAGSPPGSPAESTVPTESTAPPPPETATTTTTSTPRDDYDDGHVPVAARVHDVHVAARDDGGHHVHVDAEDGDDDHHVHVTARNDRSTTDVSARNDGSTTDVSARAASDSTV